jgi:arginine decarboxylase
MSKNKPEISFLLVDDDVKWMKATSAIFDKEKIRFEQIYDANLSIVSVTASDNVIYEKDEEGVRIKVKNPGKALLNLLNSSISENCQAILLDWELETDSEHEKEKLIDKIRKLRPELGVFIITSVIDGYSIVKDAKGKIEDFFFKGSSVETDMHGTIARLMSYIKTKRELPFWDAYKKYINDSIDSWHTPGHSGGRSFRISPYINEFYHFFGNETFRADLSISVDRLGSLLDSTGYIGLAQEKVSKVFGAEKSFFVTNGSSTSNKIILQTVLRPGDHVIVDRNCHKSVHYGIIQTGAIPQYLESDYNKELGIFAPPSIKKIEKILKGKEKGFFKLLVITGCTYEGLISDIKSIVKIAHDHQTKVFIDEAWFAYSNFHPAYRGFAAVIAKADYVTHSSHKVLSAFSQASMIHVNDPDFDADYFREIFYIYTSTSPQYQLIASMDICTGQMYLEGFKLINQARNYALHFRKKIKDELNYFKVVEKDDFNTYFDHLKSEGADLDILKVLVDFSATGLEAKTLLKRIRDDSRLEIEKSTNTTFLVLFTIGTDNQKAIRLFNILNEIDKEISAKQTDTERTIALTKYKDIPKGIVLKDNPRNAFIGKRKKIKVSELIPGQISSGMVTPYPPGIPLLVPGQEIHDEHINYLVFLIENKVEVHGLFNNDSIYITLSG